MLLAAVDQPHKFCLVTPPLCPFYPGSHLPVYGSSPLLWELLAISLTALVLTKDYIGGGRLKPKSLLSAMINRACFQEGVPKGATTEWNWNLFLTARLSILIFKVHNKAGSPASISYQWIQHCTITCSPMHLYFSTRLLHLSGTQFPVKHVLDTTAHRKIGVLTDRELSSASRF